MSLRTLLFLGLFVVCTVGALYAPLLGVLGYVAHYMIGPQRQWWEAAIQHWGLRYSFMLAAATALGIVLNWRRLRYGRRFFTRHEWWMLVFLGIVWLSTLLTEATEGRYEADFADHPSLKLTKVLLFALMMTHVVTTFRSLNALFWVLVLSALILGLQAYSTPYGSFVSGRLESVGGPDFSDANRLAGFLAGMFFIVGVQFVRSGWMGRVVTFLAGGFVANGIVLTRSRGGAAGVAAGGLVALLLAPKRYRGLIVLGLLLAGLGWLYLSDPQFISRTGTILDDTDQMDVSATSRLEIWSGAWQMIGDHPLGVGAGNFYQNIGDYATNHPGRDAHNTLLRCAGELGWIGIALFLWVVVSAVLVLRRCVRDAESLSPPRRKDALWWAFGLQTGLAAVLVYGMTGTLIYTEYLWWFVALPVCLSRAIANCKEDEGELLSAEAARPETANATA